MRPTLAALLLFPLPATSALAQDTDPVARDVDSVARTAPAVTGRLWFIEPRYRLELLEVKARDETGFDFPGSDEILVIADLEGGLPETSYELWIDKGMGDMDSGEVVKFGPDHACLMRAVDDVRDRRWSCAADGAILPFTVTFTVLERDGVGRTIWEAATGGGLGFCVNGDGPQTDLTPDCLPGGSADQFNSIGSVRKIYSAQDLAGMTVGQSRQDNLVVNYCSATLTIDNGICGVAGWLDAWNGVYRISVRITRLPNRIADFDLAHAPMALPTVINRPTN